MQPFQKATFVPPTDQQIKMIAEKTNRPESIIRAIIKDEAENSLVFINDIYQVHVKNYSDEFIWLSIRR